MVNKKKITTLALICLTNAVTAIPGLRTLGLASTSFVGRMSSYVSPMATKSVTPMARSNPAGNLRGVSTQASKIYGSDLLSKNNDKTDFSDWTTVAPAFEEHGFDFVPEGRVEKPKSKKSSFNIHNVDLNRIYLDRLEKLSDSIMENGAILHNSILCVRSSVPKLIAQGKKIKTKLENGEDLGMGGDDDGKTLGGIAITIAAKPYLKPCFTFCAGLASTHPLTVSLGFGALAAVPYVADRCKSKYLKMIYEPIQSEIESKEDRHWTQYRAEENNYGPKLQTTGVLDNLEDGSQEEYLHAFSTRSSRNQILNSNSNDQDRNIDQISGNNQDQNIG